MDNRVRHLLKKAFVSRSIYLLVVLNLCFVASVMRQVRHGEHGVARCVAPKTMEITACYFPPPPPLWKVAWIVLNAPPLLASAFISETLESAFPQLCGLMTFFSLSVAAAGVWLQWTMVGFGVDYLIKRWRVKLRSRYGDFKMAHDQF